ncbi:MAG: GDP-mannose 4,6-dehydratase [Bdellovibrionota bacterium]
MTTCLVTGADGFIGSHLVESLVAEDCNVKALAQYNSFNDHGWIETFPKSVRERIEVASGDIRDPFFCNSLCKEVDVVFHLAALIAIPYSYHAARSYLETNVLGTQNICEASLRNHVKKIILTSTSEVYGTARYVPIDEKHPLQPQSPYSASKIGADAIAMSYYYSYDLPLNILRPFNTFGPRQSNRAVIPTIITQISNGKSEIELGNIQATRDFNYVQDTAQAFIEISKLDTYGHILNYGSNREISILDTVNLIAKLMEKEVTVLQKKERLRPEKSEVERLLCNPSMFYEMTSFKGIYGLEEGLRKTISWFQKEENLKRYKEYEYNI